MTIGTLHAGTRFNILAETVEMTGTVRTLSETTHRKIEQWMHSQVQGTAKAHGIQAELQYEVLGSVLNNTPKMAEFAGAIGETLYGKKKVTALSEASMGGEDFPEYLKAAPGCFIYIGVGNKKKPLILGTTLNLTWMKPLSQWAPIF